MGFRLTAINRCLRAIGEAPVSAITDPVPDAQSANTMIDEVTKDVLTAGWSCNSAFNVKMLPDSNSEIVLGSSVIRIDTAGASASINVTTHVDEIAKTTKLFQVKDQTTIFTYPVYVDVVYYYDIDNIPYHLQNYISCRAARLFQQAQLGSGTVDAVVAKNEADAWMKVVEYEAEQDDSNCLTDSAYLAYVTGRNNYLYGK